MNIRRIMYPAVFLFTILLASACSKNNIYVDIDEPNASNSGSSDSNSDNGNQQKTLVSFTAAVESRNMTRAMSPMAKGLQSWLAAYQSGTSDIINSQPVAEGDYITSSVGMLTGISGYKMYLSNNTYNLYAVSCNSAEAAPIFTNGTSEPLNSGVDYLWWGALRQDVTGSQLNVPISYQHAATQVVVVVTAGANITLNKIVSATITPTQSGAKMDLSTGIIHSSTEYGKAADMGVNEFTIQYIMLPLKSSAPMTLTLNILVNGENTPRTYTAPIAPPNDNLAAGDSYQFRAVIDENTISFPNVYVKEWTEVDKTGKPLYPIQ